MSTTDGNQYSPSPSERVRDQVARYEATDGADGGDLGGRPVVILTTRGATSGTIRKTPIMRVVDSDAYVAIASYAGNPHNPAWYRNLVAQPDAEIRDRARRIRVRAREVHGDEKARLWAIADAGNPAYADYRSHAGRDIPVLVLDPVSEGRSPSELSETSVSRGPLVGELPRRSKARSAAARNLSSSRMTREPAGWAKL